MTTVKSTIVQDRLFNPDDNRFIDFLLLNVSAAGISHLYPFFMKQFVKGIEG